LIHTSALSKASTGPFVTYQDAAKHALLYIRGLTAAAGGRSAQSYDSLAKGLAALLRTAPGAHPREQIAFLKTLGLMGDSNVPVERSDAKTHTSKIEMKAVTVATTPNAKDDIATRSDNLPVDLVLYSANVVSSGALNVALTEIWIAFMHWQPKLAPTTHKGSTSRLPVKPARSAGILESNVVSAAVNVNWFDAHQADWAKITKTVNGDRIRQSGRLLTLESTFHA